MSPFSAKNGSSVPRRFERVDDRSAGAERLGLGDPRDGGISPSRLDERVERLLEIGRGEHDLVHAVASQVVQHVIEGRPVHEREQRFGQRLGERAQTRSLAAHQHDGLHPATLPLSQASSARRRSAIHASGRVRRRHPAARCCGSSGRCCASASAVIRRDRPVETPPLVQDLDLGGEQDVPTRVVQTRGHVELLAVEEERLVEHAHFVERLARAAACSSRRPSRPGARSSGPTPPCGTGA